MSFLSTVRALFTAGKGIVVGMPDADSMDDPMALFHAWFNAAGSSGLFMPEAMALSTSTPEGRPSSRMVLLKTADERGFVFYTNHGSRKGSELETNPHAALLFHWAVLERQVRVEGRVERVSAEESNEYFQSRARGSRIGAWASAQSRPLDARKTLETAVRETEKRFEGGEVPLPDHWGGYLVRPERMEFWQGRPFRLHDRIVFEKEDDAWVTSRLYP